MNDNLCEGCSEYQNAICRRMSKSVHQIFYSFTAYNIEKKRRVKCSFACIPSARYHRNLIIMLKDKYNQVSDIFEDKLEI